MNPTQSALSMLASQSHVSQAFTATLAAQLDTARAVTPSLPFTVNGRATDRIGAIGALQTGVTVRTARAVAERTLSGEHRLPYTVIPNGRGIVTYHASAPLAIAALAST